MHSKSSKPSDHAAHAVRVVAAGGVGLCMTLATASLSSLFGLDGVAVNTGAGMWTLELVHLSPPGSLPAYALLALAVVIFGLVVAFVLRAIEPAPRDTDQS